MILPEKREKETPLEDVPEVGGRTRHRRSTRRLEKRARGRLSYQHSKGCMKFRHNVTLLCYYYVSVDAELASRAGLTPEQ
eukprot:1642144-Amphidinium_carterae.1